LLCSTWQTFDMWCTSFRDLITLYSGPFGEGLDQIYQNRNKIISTNISCSASVIKSGGFVSYIMAHAKQLLSFSTHTCIVYILFIFELLHWSDCVYMLMCTAYMIIERYLAVTWKARLNESLASFYFYWNHEGLQNLIISAEKCSKFS